MNTLSFIRILIILFIQYVYCKNTFDFLYHESTAQEETVLGRTLALRIVLGILLFLLFVLADITDYKVLDCSTTTIASEIEKDDYTNAEKYVMMLFADK